MGESFNKPKVPYKYTRSKFSIPDNANIMLVGDSVLDNFYWLEDNKLDLRRQLELMQSEKTKGMIYNFAVDESETNDIIPGKTPAHHYQYERKQYSMYEYPCAEDGRVYPIKLAKNVTEKNPDRDNVVVLSVGGNDGRVSLPLLMKPGSSFDDVVSAMEKRNFKKNLVKIIEEFLKVTDKIILVLVYKPYKLMIPGKAKEMNALYDYFRTYYQELSKKFCLPLIDLSITFDYNDPTHYGKGTGSSPIEPSNKSSQFIADLISFVLGDFVFGSKESKVYYGIENIKVEKL